MASLVNLCRFQTSTTGTGSTIAVGSAVSGYLTPAQAGAVDGKVYSYGIKDGSQSEAGRFTYSSSGPQFTGRTVTNSTNSNAAINLSGAAEVFITALADDFTKRETLTANRTYYVDNTNGSDSNDGLVSGSGGAFKTIQKALDAVSVLDIRTFSVTINVADGTYTGANTVNGPWLGSGIVSVVGNTTTPANVVINPSGTTCFNAQNGGSLTVSGMELRGNVGLLADTNGNIRVGPSMRFGAATAYQVYARNGGTIGITSNYSVVGGALYHLVVGTSARVIATSLTVTLTGTPAFSGAFVQANGTGAYAEYFLNTFSGSATGPRYNAANGGFISVNGAGTSYLPGNAAGSGTNFGTSPYGLYT